jgi:hypothetical protein
VVNNANTPGFDGHAKPKRLRLDGHALTQYMPIAFGIKKSKDNAFIILYIFTL